MDIYDFVEAIKTKPHVSFEAFYKSYYPKLAAYASLFLTNDEAHDVVQEVFLNLLERKDKNLNNKTLNAYLYKSDRKSVV